MTSTLSQSHLARHAENLIMTNTSRSVYEHVDARPLQLVAHAVRLGDREERLAYEVRAHDDVP